MKLYLLIFTSVSCNAPSVLDVGANASNSSKETHIASSLQNQTSLLAATRFVTVGIPGWGGWGSWVGGARPQTISMGSAWRYGHNPYSYGQLVTPRRLTTPGYSYWRLPGKGLLMLSPNHRQHYFPTETPDHPLCLGKPMTSFRLLLLGE